MSVKIKSGPRCPLWCEPFDRDLSVALSRAVEAHLVVFVRWQKTQLHINAAGWSLSELLYDRGCLIREATFRSDSLIHANFLAGIVVFDQQSFLFVCDYDRELSGFINASIELPARWHAVRRNNAIEIRIRQQVFGDLPVELCVAEECKDQEMKH